MANVSIYRRESVMINPKRKRKNPPLSLSLSPPPLSLYEAKGIKYKEREEG